MNAFFNNSVRAFLTGSLLVAWAVTSGCATGSAQTTNTSSSARSEEQAVSAIREVIRRYEVALNANGLEEILGLYGSSPVFMPQHAPAIVGRDAVRAGYQQVFATLKLNIRFEIYEVQQVGEWAWARTSSAGKTRILVSGTEIAEGNNELFVFRREQGEWKIHRYLFSTNRPRG